MNRQARALTSAATACDRGRRTPQNSQLDAGGLKRLRAARVVLDAHDLPFPESDHLEQLRDEALAADPFEALAAQLHEDETAEVEHLPRPQAVRRRAPEHRLHHVVCGGACTPGILARGTPGRVVVQSRAQLAMVRTPRELVDLADGVAVSQRAAAT